MEGLPMTNATRKALHCYIDDPAHDAWHGFCTDNGVSVSALLQALGDEIDNTLGDESPMGPVLIKRARHIDAVRRRRKNGDT
jgi:hypothetical protein